MTAEKPEILATSAASAKPVVLGADAVRVPLEPVASLANGKLAGRIGAASAGQKFYLVIKGLRTGEQPEVLYQVYLALPDGAAPQPSDPHYLGSFNFFNAAAGDSRVNTYDVTGLVKNLQAGQQLTKAVTVTIVPAGTPKAGAKPTIGEIATWTGSCAKQRASGKGTLTWQTGDAVQRYDGTMVDGHLEGQGAYQLTPTMRYEGAFKADDFEGKGVMVEGGDRYEGLWRAGKRNGRGVLTTPGGNRYEGDFKDDAITGQGVLTLRDGRKFEGQLYDGKPHGQGKLTEPSGTYAGFWMNGCFNDGTRRASFGVDPAGCP